MSRDKEIVIVGAAESTNIGTVPDQSALQLGTDAALQAISDAGMSISDIDGVASTLQTVELAHHLGIRTRYLDGTVVGGCSYMLHVRHAVAALRDGKASAVLVVHGESGRSRVGMAPRFPDPASPGGQFERPFGVSGTFSSFTLPVMAYLDKYGLGEADLAEVSVAQSRWSSQVPRALRQELLTVESVLASRLIAWPFHIVECCPLTDGGGALLLTTAERAADLDLAHPAVTIAGTGESSEGPGVSFMDDLTTFRGFRDSSSEALRDAGMNTGDIDHLMVYDAYAHLPLYGLEDLGFVGRGEAVEFIRSGATSPGGSLPMNTNGGGLMYTHTGMYGMFALTEAVRQLQHRAAAQVDGVRTSMVQGVGGMFGAAGAVVLQRR